MVKGLIRGQNQIKTLKHANIWSEILLYDSIKHVVTSKKAIYLIDDQIYCFLVNPYLTKPLIKAAIEPSP